MTANYLIGIGGSGSRCLEATLHLSAAGLGPESLWLGQVDPDKGNGNVERTRALLETYLALQRPFRGADHRLSETCPLFRTAVTVPEAGYDWSPIKDHPHIASLFNRARMAEGERALFDALYSPAMEHRMDLSVGFRGRPAIGSAVIAATEDPDDDFWGGLLEAVQKLGRGEDVRLFLVGSIFGGTGAAGMPTLARMMRRRLGKAGRDRVRIGGALLLPYFAFPDQQADAKEQAARSAAFIEQARGALSHYHRMLTGKGERVFDQLLVLGWPQLIPLETFAVGRAEQANPPPLPELLAAIGAFDFFASPADRSGLSLLGFKDEAPFDWTCMPPIGNAAMADGSPSVKQVLGGLVRFAYAFQMIYGETLKSTGYDAVQRQTWYRSLVTDAKVDPVAERIKQLVAGLSDYSALLLRWCGTLQKLSATERVPVRLFDMGQLLEGEVKQGLLPLRHSVADPGTFDRLVVGADTGLKLPAILEQLSVKAPDTESRGLGRFVSALAAASSLRATR